MTTRRLFLIRHAKAEPHGRTDAKRKLAPRGESDAREIGTWLAEEGVQSGLAVVSPARRAVQTWELATEGLGRSPRTVLDDRVYEASVEDLLEVIHEVTPQTRTLVIVGHNPSIQVLATVLDNGAGDRKPAKEMARKFPTSGIALFELAGPWSNLAPGDADLTAFVVPRG
jgi:phosphohistidine phosphatase